MCCSLDKRITLVIDQINHAIHEPQVPNGGFSDIPANVIHRRERRLAHRKLMQNL
jgi:hypothetical protein